MLVQLTPAPDGRVDIPITVAPVSPTVLEDYRVRDLKKGALRFKAGETLGSFRVMALLDEDVLDETIRLGFGPDLPLGVTVGDTPQATVTIYDTPPGPRICGPRAGPAA